MSLCQKLKMCSKCCKVFKVNPKKPHKCFYTKCRHCKKNVHIYNHRCYIQKVKEEESNENEEEEMKENKKEETNENEESSLLSWYLPTSSV